MNYHQDNTPRKLLAIFLLLVIFIGGEFFLTDGFFVGKISDGLVKIGEPLWYGKDKFFNFISFTVAGFKNNGSLVLENSKLKTQIEEKNLIIERLKLVIDDQIQIEENISEKIINIDSGVLSQVLSGPNIPPYESFIINKGSIDGISIGDLVVEQSGIALGLIETVDKNSSKFKPFFVYGEKVSVFFPESNFGIELNGVGGGVFELSLPLDFKIIVGEKALLPGGDFYLVAAVKDIIQNETDKFKKVSLTIPLTMKSFRWVWVVGHD